MNIKAERKSPETIDKLLNMSRIESDMLKERELRCPMCNFKLEMVFSDARGHFRIKCPKCKENLVLNIAYFRTMKNKYKN